MATGQPRVFVDHAAQQLARLVVAALPQRREGAAGADDGVVVHAVFARDIGQAIGHARTAGDAVDQPAGAIQHAADDALGAAHLPQDIGVDARLRAAALTRLDGLGDAALDAVFHQLLMPVAPRPAGIDLADGAAIGVIAVGVHGRERAHATGRGPGAGGRTIGHGHALAALHERQHIHPTHAYCVDGLHRQASSEFRFT